MGGSQSSEIPGGGTEAPYMSFPVIKIPLPVQNMSLPVSQKSLPVPVKSL